MTELAGVGALLVGGAAVVAAALVLLRTGRLAIALPVLLDLLLAASLLRLVGHPDPSELAGAAALIVIKQLSSIGIRSSVGTRSRR